MHIFNQGKYKSLYAQGEGELAAVAQVVSQDQDFRPTYHIVPPTGLLNDPNGLIFDGEHYHLFYQWFPYDAMHGMKHWQHLITKDFHTFSQGDLLIPDELFESHGCYSGGAILWQEKIVAFYTGNVRRSSDNQRVPHQNIAIFEKSGRLIEKRCILERPPVGYTEHVRDPKPYITTEGKIRFVIGAQRKDLTGTALLYEMDNLESEPRLLSELNVPSFDNQNVFMWECPDLFKLAERSVFIWSPQGKIRETTQFQNNFHAVYALGELKGYDLLAEKVSELDYGFDFYAPQTVENSERILFGWVGLPDLTYPTDRYKWHSMLSLPRQLSLKHNHIYQKPLPQIYEQLVARRKITLVDSAVIDDLDTSYLQIFVENRPLVLTLFHNAQGQHLKLSYQQGILTLDRSATEQTDIMLQFDSIRHCVLEHLTQLEIFIDRSVIEIFANSGEKVLTSRFFIAHRENRFETSHPIEVEIATMTPIVYR